ncbi:MAG TPA: efflux RND transporter periplasmic adaptor subunit [Pseudomonadales bacterium]
MRGWLIVIGLCLLAAAGFGYYKYSRIQAAIAFAAGFPEQVVAVESVLATQEAWQPRTSVTGEVVARRSVSLSNELGGAIVEVGFRSGDRVRTGQVLVRLDTSEERAQLAAARADAEIARLELSRAEKLIRSGAAAQEARDQARARFDASVAAVNRLLAVIEKKTLRAPFDATTGLHELEIGQYLDKGAVIARLIGVDDAVWVDFTLPQQQATVRLGETVRVIVPGQDEELVAEVIARDAFVNERSRNVGLRALAQNAGDRLLPGSLVSVEVPMAQERVATLVPVTAVRRNSFGASVFVLKPAEQGARGGYRAALRPVTLGPQRGDRIIIAEGLEPGERVATAGAFKLREGALVNDVSRADPAGSSGAGN